MLFMKLSLLAVPLLSVAAAFGGYGGPIPAPDSVCPTANNFTILTGYTWAFQLHTGALNTQNRIIKLKPSRGESDRSVNGIPNGAIQETTPGIAAIGTFRATGPGTITATLTTSEAGVIARRATVSGRYILYPDCAGGEIMIMLNGFAVQLEFVWSNNFNQMLFVSDTMNPRYGGNVVLTGNARHAPDNCVPGVAPLDLINNTKWSFRLSQAYLYAPGDASVGTFKGFISNGSGYLTVSETTTTTTGLVTRLAPESGRYQVYGDCSGGEIMIMNRAPGAVQMEFVFVGLGYDEMFLLNDNALDPADVALAGQAFRY
jgi:hypothetical protein